MAEVDPVIYDATRERKAPRLYAHVPRAPVQGVAQL